MPRSVDDEQRHALDLLEVLTAGAVESGLGELLDEHVGLAVGDGPALQDDGVSDGLGEVALAGAGRAEEERILGRGEEVSGGEVEDQGAVHLLVEVEVEAVERLALVAEASLLDAPSDQPIAAQTGCA
jgi:hypothetical protein